MPKGDFSGREKRLFLAALAFRFGPKLFLLGVVIGDRSPYLISLK